MKSSVLVRVAGESIKKNKMRTLLTMLGIVIGVGAVIIMVAVGQGAQRGIANQINALGTNLLVITAGASNTSGVSQGAQAFNRLTVDDAEKLKREGTLFAGVTPVVMTRVQVLAGGTNWRTMINGVSTDWQTIRDWQTSSGDFFTDADLRGMRKVAVIGQTVADNLFPGVDPVGSQIQIRNEPFDIVGVLAKKGQNAVGQDQDDIVIMPYTTAQTRLSGNPRIWQILVSATSQQDITAAQQEAAAIMRESHKIGDGDDDFTVRNQTEIANAAQGTTKIMTWLLASIASVSLIVGGIGIMNIMLVSVTERTREIGIRMAIGARGSDVLTQFLVESIVMSVLGGAVGLVVGIGGASLVARFTGWSTEVPIAAVALAIGFSAAVGVFFGFYPARKAAALDPIQALRYE
ncbi:MAG TPA: ABC transporter permease [Gemmatimonadaceae bacterium]|jgi:putative ABC transport system permease protein|nr:ABC transporter permease [Gemmatimonadaceae bacterium]